MEQRGQKKKNINCPGTEALVPELHRARPGMERARVWGQLCCFHLLPELGAGENPVGLAGCPGRLEALLELLLRHFPTIAMGFGVWWDSGRHPAGVKAAAAARTSGTGGPGPVMGNPK